MTSIISRRVRAECDSAARKAGFRKHATWLWTKPIEEGVTLLLSLQKSNFGDDFNLEIGAILGDLPDKLAIWQSPLRMGIESLLSDPNAAALLKFRSSANIDAQIQELGVALERELVAELGPIDSRRRIYEFIQKCREKRARGEGAPFLITDEFLRDLQMNPSNRS